MDGSLLGVPILSGPTATLTPQTFDSTRGAVCFTWDDGYTSHYSTVAPMHAARGQLATFGIVSSLAGTNGYMTGAQIQALAGGGHEIANHSKTHQHMSGLTATQVATEYDDCTAYLQTLGITPTTFLYPFGDRSAATDSLALGRFNIVRGTTGSTSGINWLIPIGYRNDFLMAGLSWDGTAGQHAILLNAIRMAAGVTIVQRERDYTGALVSQSASTAITSTTWTQTFVARAMTDAGRVAWLDLQVAAVACEAWFDHMLFCEKGYGAQG